MNLADVTTPLLVAELKSRGDFEDALIEDFSDWDIKDEYLYRFGPHQLSEFSDKDIEMEYADRFPDDHEDVCKVVQHHRCGELTIEGRGADDLIEHIYNLANRVV